MKPKAEAPPPPPGNRSHGLSVDSEFFDAVGPTPPASPRSDDADPDAPLLDTTPGGGRRETEPVEEPDRAGDTGTDGSYRGRRARRSDSG